MQPLRFGYTLYWTKETDMTLSSNEVVATRVGINPRAQAQRQFVIDYNIPKMTNENDPPTIAGHLQHQRHNCRGRYFRNTPDKDWRVFLNMQPKPGQHEPVDLQCALKKGNDTVSETWTYRWSPP